MAQCFVRKNPASGKARRGGECAVRNTRLKPRQLLSVSGSKAGVSGGDGTPRCHAENRTRVPLLRLPQDHRGTAARRIRCEPQARPSADAGRQSAMSAAQGVCGDDRFTARSNGLPKSGARFPSVGDQSTLGGRYHLHSAAPRVRLSGGGAGRFFATSQAPRQRSREANLIAALLHFARTRLAARMGVFAFVFKGTDSVRPLAFPAAESVLGSHPCVALSRPIQVGSVSTKPIRSSTKKQRTAITPLTGCLTFGVHFRLPQNLSLPRENSTVRIVQRKMSMKLAKWRERVTIQKEPD